MIRPGDCTEWFAADGDNTYLLDFKLMFDSVVVDLGARVGEWATPIRDKYGCEVFCFEPVIPYAYALKQKGFQTYCAAVLDYSGFVFLGVENQQASVYSNEDEFGCMCLDATEIFDLIKYSEIDLMKINIEGAEYCVLESLIDNIEKIGGILVQFHKIDFYQQRYDDIAEELSKTHNLKWRFPFVWEYWEQK